MIIMIDIYSTSMAAFFIILGILIYLDRKNIEFNYILLMRRTKKGLKILDEIAKYKKFWKTVGIIGIGVCFFLMANGLYNLIIFSNWIIEGKIKEPLGGIVVPSPTSKVEIGPGYIKFPFLYWLIILPIILIPHELFHGIICRVERIRIKSIGLILFLFLSGAFVEPDEKKLKKAKLLSKLKIFAAGSFANILVSLLLFTPYLNIGLIPNVLWPALTPGQVEIVGVNETSPAAQAGITPGMLLEEINGVPVKVTYSEFLNGTFFSSKIIESLKPGNNITIKTNVSTYTLTVGKIKENNTTRPYLGVEPKLVLNTNRDVFIFVSELFTWMWILNFAVAVFNIFPIYPLDGGLIVYSILEKLTKKYKEITIAITMLTIGLVLFTIIGPSLVVTLQSF